MWDNFFNSRGESNFTPDNPSNYGYDAISQIKKGKFTYAQTIANMYSISELFPPAIINSDITGNYQASCDNVSLNYISSDPSVYYPVPMWLSYLNPNRGSLYVQSLVCVSGKPSSDETSIDVDPAVLGSTTWTTSDVALFSITNCPAGQTKCVFGADGYNSSMISSSPVEKTPLLLVIMLQSFW